MPRSDGKLVKYEAIVPNLSLDISSLLENDTNQDPRYCMCNNIATLECTICKVSNGEDAVKYCPLCKGHAESLHESTDHNFRPVHILEKSLTMELMAVICIRFNHYVTFVRKGFETDSPWLFFDSMAGTYPEVTEVDNLGRILEALEKQPKHYKNAMNNNHFVRRILTDSHICIYQSRHIPHSQ